MFILHTIFSMFDSFYLPFAIIYFVGRIYLGCLSNEACSYVTIKDYFSAEILIIATSCCLQISIFLLLLQLQEYWRTEGTVNTFFILLIFFFFSVIIKKKILINMVPQNLIPKIGFMFLFKILIF